MIAWVAFRRYSPPTRSGRSKNISLAPDDISRLFEPKVLTGWERWDAEAVKAGKPSPVEAVSEDDNLLIKGNNLLALHSLKRRYAPKFSIQNEPKA